MSKMPTSEQVKAVETILQTQARLVQVNKDRAKDHLLRISLLLARQKTK